MELFPWYVEVKDASLTYRRFQFEAEPRPGYCHLKIEIHQGILIFCATQLIYYQGRPVGLAEDDIRSKIISMLRAEGLMWSTRPCLGLDHIFRWRFERKVRSDMLRYLNDRSIWVRHYTPDTSFAGNNSFALVDFADPFVVFTDIETVVDRTGLDQAFFDIPVEELRIERSY